PAAQSGPRPVIRKTGQLFPGRRALETGTPGRAHRHRGASQGEESGRQGNHRPRSIRSGTQGIALKGGLSLRERFGCVRVAARAVVPPSVHDKKPRPRTIAPWVRRVDGPPAAAGSESPGPFASGPRAAFPAPPPP